MAVCTPHMKSNMVLVMQMVHSVNWIIHGAIWGRPAAAEGEKRERKERPRGEKKERPRGERRERRERKEVEAPAERPDRLPQPDRKELDAQCAALDKKQDECRARMAEIKAIVDSKQAGRGAVMSATKEALYEQKDRVNAEIKAMDAARDSARAQQKTIKDKCKFVSVAQVDEAVARLEDKMSHTTMSLNDEKKIMQQISELKKSRQFVQQYSAVKDAAAGDVGGREGAMTRVKALNEKIKGLKQREDAQKKEIEAIREKVGVEKDNIPDLIKEKSANWETLQQCKAARNKLWEEYKKKEDAYWEVELLFRAWQRVDKQKKWEAGLEERKARDAERKAREEAMRPDPFTG